jgi:hypothetical protein
MPLSVRNADEAALMLELITAELSPQSGNPGSGQQTLKPRRLSRMQQGLWLSQDGHAAPLFQRLYMVHVCFFSFFRLGLEWHKNGMSYRERYHGGVYTYNQGKNELAI